MNRKEPGRKYFYFLSFSQNDDVDGGDGLHADSSVAVPEVQPTVSLNDAQDMIQKLKLFALNAGN